MYSLEDGAFLIRLARAAIEKYLNEGVLISPPKDAPDELKKRAGIFVTLKTFPKRELRGCIGYPEPTFPLIDAACKAAVSVAVEDPRFPPLSDAELKRTLIEVTVLTPPEIIKTTSPTEYVNNIEIGRDGLIVERGTRRGLLLPQVPVDLGWGKEDFLSHTCIKAGLTADCWLDENTKIYKFSGLVFSEVEPKGEVKERVLTSTS